MVIEDTHEVAHVSLPFTVLKLAARRNGKGEFIVPSCACLLTVYGFETTLNLGQWGREKCCACLLTVYGFETTPSFRC